MATIIAGIVLACLAGLSIVSVFRRSKANGGQGVGCSGCCSHCSARCSPDLDDARSPGS